jgi:hypothetical protein
MNKQEEAGTPEAEANEKRLLRNWITGRKETWIDDPKNIKNAQTEQSARANLIYEQYIKDQQGK